MNMPSSSDDCIRQLEIMLTNISSGHKVRSDLELSDEQIVLLNQCPIDDVIRLLERLRRSSDRYVQERAFIAFRCLEGLDQVRFLASNLRTGPDKWWRSVYCTELAAYRDPRAIGALCEALATDEDGDVRFSAARGLQKVGDASALPVLDHTVWHDTGANWEGWTVAGAAWKAAEWIRGEPGAHRPVEVWMAERPPMPLREVVASLDTLGHHLTIYGSGQEVWSADSLMFLVPPTEYRDRLYFDYHLTYFLEVARAIEMLRTWSDERAGQIPTVGEACELLLEFNREREAQALASRVLSETRLRELPQDTTLEPADLDDLPF